MALRKDNTINCHDSDDTICFLILGHFLLLGSPWNKTSIEVLEWFTCVTARISTKVLIFKKIKMNLRIVPTETSLCKLWRPCKNSLCFQESYSCLILCEWCFSHNWPTLRREKQANKHTLIVTKYLAPWIFELKDVYYNNLILMTLPLLFKAVINKTNEYICLNKLPN